MAPPKKLLFLPGGITSACSGTGTNADNDKPSDTKIPSASALAPPTLYTPAPPAHPFFYLLKYKVDKTLPPETEFSFLLMETKNNNPFTKDTEDQVIRRKAGDLGGGNISAMMIQAGDETERIYDASGTQSSGTFNMPNFSNRPTVAAAPADLKYSKSLRLLKPDTDYHLYVRVNNAAPILLESPRTAAVALKTKNAGTPDEYKFLTYDVDTAAQDSTLTLSTRDAEPFYPAASLLTWKDNASIFANISSLFSVSGTLESIFRMSNQGKVVINTLVTSVSSDFYNLRQVDAALEVTGMTDPADNAWVHWFDSNTDLNVWPTISIVNGAIEHGGQNQQDILLLDASNSSFYSKILY